MAVISKANQTIGCPPILVGNLTVCLVLRHALVAYYHILQTQSKHKR